MTQRERGVVSAASDLLLRSSFNFFAFNLDDGDAGDDDDNMAELMWIHDVGIG